MTTDDATLPGALASDPKLIQLRPKFRLQIGYVLAELEVQGFQPRISNAHRTQAEQEEKFRLGYSKSKTVRHHGWGLACDVIDRRWGWKYIKDCANFFLALRAACDLHNVANGAYYRQTNGWAMWGMGWDPAHCWDHLAHREDMETYGPEQWGSGLVEVGRDA